MEDIVEKENFQHLDSTHPVLANKMSVANDTPRHPLSDLKQVARPSTDVKVKKRTSLPFMQTPNSCRTKTSHRKIKPSTLVYEDSIDLGKGMRQPINEQLEQKNEEDTNVEEFVLEVLTECVKEMEKENLEGHCDMVGSQSTTNSDNHDDNKENRDEVKQSIESEKPVPVPDTMNQKYLQLKDEPECSRPSSKSAEFETCLTEETLLANTSQDVCNEGESFAESTKSEEELLADTPVTAPSVGRLTEDIPRSVLFTVKTPKVNFLEQLALRERVKEASRCLESFVVHKDERTLDSEQTVRSVRMRSVEVKDMSCSPMPVQHCESSTQYEMETQSMMCSPMPVPHNDVFTQHEIVTQSTMCSPMPIPHSDVFTQHELETQSVMCSPMPVSNSDVSTQHEADTQSTMCSPIRIPGIESSVQAVVETRSVMCTPIRVPVLDMSVQNVAETQSTSCSPMLVPHTDSSTQDETEYQSIMCSPMVPCPNQDKSILVTGPESSESCTQTDDKCTDDKAVSVYPDTTTTGTGVEESPMISCGTGMTPLKLGNKQTKNHYLVESSESCTQTDDKCTDDKAVSVYPDTTTTGTGVEESPMISCGTGMTPLKLGNKQNKKLTAEDIRKQHPRVLANEFETLKSQNSRLEHQVNAMKLDSKKLVSQEAQLNDLQSNKNALEEERDSFVKQCEEWKSKFEDMQMENESLRVEHEIEMLKLKEEYESNDYHSHFLMSQELVQELQAEMLKLKEEYESNDYHAHFLMSQKLVQELQAELQQYKELLPDLQRSQSLMAALKMQYTSSFTKLKSANKILIDRKHELDQQEEQIVRNKIELASLEEERNSIVTERQQSAEKIIGFEQSITEMKADIEQKNVQIKQLEEATSDRDLLSKTLKTAERTLEMRDNEIDLLEKDLFECRELIYSQMEERKELEAREKTLTAELDAVKMEGTELKDLERTLEMRDNEIDILEKDLFECREVIYSQMEERKELETREKTLMAELDAAKMEGTELKDLERTLEMRDSEIDMLEKDLFECQEVIYSQMEERKELEAREKTLTSELDAAKMEGTELKDCLSRLCDKEQEGRATAKNLEEELEGTKSHASRMIKQLGSEITDCSLSIGQLTDHMTSVLDQLKRKAGIEDIQDLNQAETNEAVAIEVNKSIHKKKWHPRKSFVSQILHAVGTAGSETDNVKQSEKQTGLQLDINSDAALEKQTSENQSGNQSHSEACENMDNPSSEGHQKLESSNGSAFEPVKFVEPSVSSIANDSQNVTVRSRTKGNESKKVRVNEPLSATNETSNIVESETKEVKLTNQMTSIADLFEKIIHTAQLVEKALRSSLQDLRSENYDLTRKVSQCEYSEKRTSVQLEVTQNELEKCRKLIKQHEATIANLSDKFEAVLDRQSEAEKQSMEREIRTLRSKIQSLEGEKEMLNDQFTELLNKVRSQSADQPPIVDVNAQKEIVLLKKKVEKYWTSKCEKEELLCAEKLKAKQLTNKLEENWKRADAEVLRLYELVNRIRNATVLSGRSGEDPDLQKILKIVDGVEKEAESVLKPVKTVRW